MSRTRELDFELTISGQTFPVTAIYTADLESDDSGRVRPHLADLAFKVYYPHDLEFDPPKVLFTEEDRPIAFYDAIEAYLDNYLSEKYREA